MNVCNCWRADGGQHLAAGVLAALFGLLAGSQSAAGSVAPGGAADGFATLNAEVTGCLRGGPPLLTVAAEPISGGCRCACPLVSAAFP